MIHTAFDHDFSNFVANCEKDARVIHALGKALAGSNRPLFITSGVGMGGGHGHPAREDVFDQSHPNPRIASELAGREVSARGVRVSVVRLPQVHDTHRQGLISSFIDIAREKGFSAYVGDGTNRWSAAPVLDVARLYRLALEKDAGPAVYNAVAEEGVPMRAIAQVVGEGLGVPVVSLSADEVPGYFGWLAGFARLDMLASSEWTRKALDWSPTGPGLIADLKAMDYVSALKPQ